MPANAGAPLPDSRIRRRAEYERVYSEGRKLFGRYMILFCLGRSEPPSRCGLAVSRKVGGAVVRNRVKRRMREICRRELAAAPEPPADFVLSLRREAAEAPYEDLRQEVARLVRKARKR